MRLLWKFVKIAIVLAIAIPLCMIALTMALGLFGAVTALLFLVLRFAIFALIIWAVIRFAVAVLSGGSRPTKPIAMKPLPAVDPYQEAAMRELDRELGEPSR